CRGAVRDGTMSRPGGPPACSSVAARSASCSHRPPDPCSNLSCSISRSLRPTARCPTRP
ncbi:MAG: hypothetical protein AVDCRST_MAG20-2039, partial [uncultured Acidimicrobiales bacterium]